MQTVTPLKSRKTDDFCTPFPSRCIRKLTSSPDYLIGLEEERRGNRQAEDLRGFEVND